ncbi:MAG: hypothetical protein ACFFC7_17435 [Candidatus Hermodarchaeota archaeon]
MKNKKNFIMAILFLSILVMAIFPANAQIIPVIEIEKDTDTFTPIVIGGNSYYIIGSNNLERPYDVFYTGIGGGADVDCNYGTSASYNSIYSTYLDPDEQLPADITEANRRYHPNPFLDPLGDPLPKLVRLDNPNATFTVMQQKPFSLHINYSFTFLAEQSVEYIGLLQSSEPIYLDIEIHNTINLGMSLIAGISFGSADPAELGLYTAKNTIPVFPKATTTNFTFWLDPSGPASSLVTFTPRPFSTYSVTNGYEYVDFEGVNKTAIPVNSTYIGNINQGSFENISGGFIEPSANRIFSMRYFTLPIVKDSEYRIFVNIEDLISTVGEVIPGIVLSFLINGDMTNPSYEELSGTLDNTGLRIRALETTDLVIALYARGVIRANYAIFFNQVTPIPEQVEPLSLNTPVQLYEDILYEFTFAQDVMMAINYSAMDQDVEFYKLSDGEWEYVILTSSVGNGFLDHIPGDVYTNIPGSLDERWYYIPAGTYAVKTDDAPRLDDEIQFNTITVQTFSDSTTLNVNQDSLFALQLPLTYHRYNNYSLSTADHINQSVWYDFFIKGKYDENIIGTISTSNIQMGNQQDSGIWQDWNVNYTQPYAIIPARTNEIPILVLRPVQATQNVSYPSDLVDMFTASLTITHTVPANYYPNFAVNGFASYGVGDGYFIPISTPVVGTSTISINDYYSDDYRHKYAIPLIVDPDSVYNITVYLVGNVSAPLGHNATFDGLTVTSRNMASLEVFSSEAQYINDTHRWRTLWALTLSGSDHHLYVDIDRTDGFPYRNATMIITLTKLPITKLSFNIPDMSSYSWSSTRYSGELLYNDSLLLEVPAEYVIFPAGLGLELLLLLGGIVLAGVVVAAVIIYVTRRQGKVPM